MFSLIITIVSIALVAALALATLYYGGGAYNEASGRAKAATIVNQGQQLLGASELYFAQRGAWPASVQQLVQDGYLKDEPLAKLGLAPAWAANNWTMPLAGEPVFVLPTDAVSACRSVNDRIYGEDGILPTVQADVVMQCFTADANFQNMWSIAGRTAASLTAAAASPESPFTVADLRSGPLPAADSSAWALKPGEKYVPPSASGGDSGDGEGAGDPGGGDGTTEPPATVTATVTSQSIAFGEVLLGQSQSIGGSLTNTGTGDLVFSGEPSLQGDPAFSLSSTCKGTLAPGASCSYTVTFAPTVATSASATLQFFSNANPAAPSISVTGQGFEQPVFSASVSRTPVSFPDTFIGQSETLSGTVTNSGNRNLVFSQAPTLTGSGVFALDSNCSGTLAPGDSCDYSVTFTPTSTGALGATIRFFANTDVAIPNVSVVGTGKVPPVISATLSRNPVAFGNVVPGATSTLTGTLTSSGNSPLVFNAAPSFTGASDFQFSTTCSGTLQPSQTCTYSVTYTPVDEATKNGSISFNTNADSAIPNVPVSGTGGFTRASSAFNQGGRGGHSGTAPTYSNGGRTVAFSGGLQGVPSQPSLPNYGKWYWEATVSSGGFPIVGVGTLPITNHIGTPGTGPGYPVSCGIANSGGVFKGSSSNVTAATPGSNPATATILGFEWDGTAGTLRMLRNNLWVGTCTFTGSNVLYPVASNGSSGNGSSITMSLQPAEMTFTSGRTNFVFGLPQP